MSEQTAAAQNHEAYARKAVVDIATAFRTATRKTAFRNMGLVGLTFAAASVALYKDPDMVLPVSALAGAAALSQARGRQKHMRAEFEQIMEAVPQGFQGIVHTELREFEKALNNGKLNYGIKDIDPRKHGIKYVASMAVGIFTPAFIPAQYMLMLAGDEMQRLRAMDLRATEAINRNQPSPSPQPGK